MNYPVWELELGGGLLIAVVSILHVFVSHFAIGGGLFLVITEHLARRRDDAHLIRYLVTHSRFFALLTLVFGAVTGVGIWFSIGLVSPAATSSLIHIFVWGWAIEWVFFLVEIAAAIVYYTTWRRIPASRHLAVGWVYFVAAFLSLVVINGILSFMLTPGGWLETRSLAAAFWNPTYWPSLVARTMICVALAGIYALVTGVRIKHDATRRWLLRYAGVWALAGSLGAAGALAWYHGAVPAGTAALLAGAQPVAARAMSVLTWSGLAVVILSLVPVLAPKHLDMGMAVVLLVAALVSFGSFEWAREAIRKPYVIHGYMYGNGLLVDESTELAASGDGLLAHAIWVRKATPAPGMGGAAGAATPRGDAAPLPVDAGEELFRIACRTCHTVDGHHGLRSRMQGLDAPFIERLIGSLEHLRGSMPPFAGNAAERRALARFLVAQTDPHQGMVDGAEVYAKRCGVCHQRGGAAGLESALEGNGRDDLLEMLGYLTDLDERMPPWSGSDTDAQRLVDHILSWYPAAEEE
ncbi:MAG: c-type cytochrome [Candidatus Eiseniibacteriota bacterium]|jgi:mono/diheme cytochrome c family protein